jgi:hypothetical protein
MANSNGWGDGAANNTIGWGQGANNAIGWGDIHADSWSGLTDISGLPTTDPDAQAFITAAAITDPTQQAAINTLVVDLKGYSIWTKMKALYPFVGGTSSTHKLNLKDPRDLDAAFRLVFNGGWTHSSNGALPNGTNAFADTKLNARNILTSNNTSFGVYIPTTHKNVSGHGCWDLAVTQRCNLLQFTGYYSQISSSTTSAFFNSNQNGFIQGSRINATLNKLYRNGSVLATNTTNETTPYPLANFYFSYINNSGSFTDYGSNELRFSYISDGLTDAEAANLYTAVQAFQTTLSRNV